MSKIKTWNLYRYCSISRSHSHSPYLALSLSRSLSLSCKLFIGLGCQFSYYFLGNQTEFFVLKTYFWSVCFCLDLNFFHILLFTLSILNFCGFCSWIWNAMSKLNLWFCVLRAFNVIAGAFALVFQLNEWSRRVQNSLSVGLKARTSIVE